jgi:hypothetical protein
LDFLGMGVLPGAKAMLDLEAMLDLAARQGGDASSGVWERMRWRRINHGKVLEHAVKAVERVARTCKRYEKKFAVCWRLQNCLRNDGAKIAGR